MASLDLPAASISRTPRSRSVRSGNGRSSGPGGRAGEVRRDAAGQRGTEHHAAGRGGPHRVVDLLGPRALEQVAGGAGPDGRQDRVVVLVHGQHDDLDVRVPPGDEAGGLDPVEVGHLDVHDDDVRLGLGDQVQRLAAVARRADHLDAVQRAEQGDQPVAHDLVVVDDQDLDAHDSSSFPSVWWT